MMTHIPVWIVFSVCAACLQLARNAVQKSFKCYVNDWVVTWIRFFFGLPIISVVMIVTTPIVLLLTQMTPTFFVLCVVGGLAQIGGTRCLMGCFSERQFAVGITYTKLESMFAALIGVVIFQDSVSLYGYGVIMIGFVGVLCVSLVRQTFSLKEIVMSLTTSSSLYGIGSGVLYACCSVCFRQANLALDFPDPFVRGVVTLWVVVFIQTLLLTPFLWRSYRQDICITFRHFNRSVSVGVCGILASLGWFISFGLANAAYVKTVGQIDVFISILIGWVWFKERLTSLECLGVCLVAFSVLLSMWLY